MASGLKDTLEQTSKKQQAEPAPARLTAFIVKQWLGTHCGSFRHVLLLLKANLAPLSALRPPQEPLRGMAYSRPPNTSRDPSYDICESEALAVTLGTGDKTKLISQALYGPERWPYGRPRDTRSKLLTGAVAAKERVHWWPVEPWFQHHGVPVEQGLSVLAWLGHSERLKNLTVQHVVDTFQIDSWDFDKTRGVYRHGYSNVLPLDPSLHVSCDILVKAIQEARDGMLVTPGNAQLDTWRWAPAGVVEDTIWWSGASRYYGGRTPMARMPELPDDALRCICEQLVPPVVRFNEEFIATSQQYCAQHTTDAAIQACDEEALNDVLYECDHLRLEMDAKLAEWHRIRAPLAVKFRLVSKDWRRAREKPTNDLKAELARLNQHQDRLNDAYRSVHEELSLFD